MPILDYDKGSDEINSGLKVVIKDEGPTRLIIIFRNGEMIRMAQSSQVGSSDTLTHSILETCKSCFQNTVWEMGMIMVPTSWGCYED